MQQINQEKVQEIIAEARKSSHSKEFLSLVDDFERFMNLSFAIKERGKDRFFLGELETSKELFWNRFLRICEGMQTSPESLQQQFENPSNFGVQEWQKMEETKTALFERPSSLPRRKMKQKTRV